MSLPNTISSGQTISASPVQANFSDIASEITGSLPRNGEAAMTGQLKASSGTVAAPGMAFSSDTDTGFYRKAADTIGVVAGGVEVGTIGTTGFSSFPSGTVMLFVQTTAPTGWTKSTTHNDKALRIVSGTASSGGTTAFTTVFAARTIQIANLPAHTHTVSGTTGGGGSHSHTVTSISDNQVGSDGNGAQAYQTTRTTDTAPNHTHSFSATSSSVGSGTAIDFAVQYVDVILATKD